MSHLPVDVNGWVHQLGRVPTSKRIIVCTYSASGSSGYLGHVGPVYWLLPATRQT